MSTFPSIRGRRELVEEWIRRFLSYTGLITWFGPNSAMRAWAEATAGGTENAYQLFVALVKRVTLLASSGDALTQVATERGSPRNPAQASKVLVIARPATANVTNIVLGPPAVLTVDDASSFLAGDQIRIRNGDGSETELLTIFGIVGNVITCTAGLVGTYNPGTEDVDILLRVQVPAGSSVSSSSGATFETLTAFYTSDANPILDGMSTFVGLADKAWCECTEKGTVGNIEPLSVTGLTTPIRGVVEVFNPEPGTGGLDEESDFDLKYRAMHRPTLANQETQTWVQALAREANVAVLRAVKVTGSAIGTMYAKVLNVNGGVFSSTDLSAIEAYMAQHVRSYMVVDVENVTLTSVEVEATITLDPGAVLEDVGKLVCSSIAAFLDYRKWAFGTDVDEADLLTLVNTTEGVASLETSSFLPAADVAVASDSLPTLVRVSLRDSATGDTWNADLAVSF